MSWQEGLLPLPTCTRSILQCPTTAGGCRAIVPLQLVGKGEEPLVRWGEEGAMEPFVRCVGFAMFNHGPGAQDSAGIPETELFQCGKKGKRMEYSHEGMRFLRAALLLGSCILRSSHLSNDKCELIR